MKVTEFFAGKVTWYVVYDGKCMGREKPRRRVCEQRMTEKKPCPMEIKMQQRRREGDCYWGTIEDVKRGL